MPATTSADQARHQRPTTKIIRQLATTPAAATPHQRNTAQPHQGVSFHP